MNAYNFTTNREYTGTNLEKLNAAGGGAWLTFYQLQSAGYRLTKGSHGVQLTFKGRKYYVFRITDCTFNGVPIVETIHAPEQEPKQEPASLPEPVTMVYPCYETGTDNTITIHLNERIKGKFSITGLLNMPCADLKKFYKEWCKDDKDLCEFFLVELKHGRYESSAQKKIIFGGKKSAVNPDITKAVKHMVKADRVCIQKADDKYIMTDSYMLMELSADDMMQLSDTVPLLLQLKENGKLDNVTAIKNGKEYSMDRESPDLMKFINNTDWNGDKTVNFNQSVKENDLYESSGVYAAVKKIDIFKDKVFQTVGNFKPLTKVTSDYRVMVLPCRKYS